MSPPEANATVDILDFPLTGFRNESGGDAVIKILHETATSRSASISSPKGLRLRILVTSLFLSIVSVGMGASLVAMNNWFVGIKGFEWYHGVVGFGAFLALWIELMVGMRTAWSEHVRG